MFSASVLIRQTSGITITDRCCKEAGGTAGGFPVNSLPGRFPVMLAGFEVAKLPVQISQKVSDSRMTRHV